MKTDILDNNKLLLNERVHPRLEQTGHGELVHEHMDSSSAPLLRLKRSQDLEECVPACTRTCSLARQVLACFLIHSIIEVGRTSGVSSPLAAE
ncbi:hypothetical protein MHYP_G00180900 [Metynnis hypsauchen]